MSKTNHAPTAVHATFENRGTLVDKELAEVTGGLIPGLAPIYAQMHEDVISACMDGLVIGVGLPKGK